MTHLKKVIAEELRTLKTWELEEMSGDLASLVPTTLMPGKEGYVKGVLHNLLDELWTMVVVEQRYRKAELMAEEQRFII